MSKIDASASGGAKPAAVKGDVEFSNINFVYPSRPDVQVREAINTHTHMHVHTFGLIYIIFLAIDPEWFQSKNSKW